MENIKYAIVTGSSSGIGKATADLLVSAGVKVFGLDIQEGRTENITSYICDVSDETQVVTVIRKIEETTSTLDYLVNAAGMLTIGKPLEIKKTPVKQLDAIIRINMRSAFIMIKNCYELLKNSSFPSVVNVSSEQVYKPQKYFAPYIISKSAINALTQIAALEYMDDKIRVNAVALGTVKTNIIKSFENDDEIIDKLFADKDRQIPMGIMSSKDAAEIILFLLSERAKYMTGEIIRVDGGNYLYQS